MGRTRKKEKSVMRRCIWVDVDNSPQIQFFRPIIERLVELGHQVTLTTRDCSYACQMLDLAKIPYSRVGIHYGKRKILKLFGLGIRSFQLLVFACDKHFDLAVGHGARSLPLACWLLRIPCMTIYDYEYVSSVIFDRFSTEILMPEVIPDGVCWSTRVRRQKVKKYPGIKEQVYLNDFRPNPRIVKDLDIPTNKVIVTLRPPATMAHYHDPKTETLFYELLSFLVGREDIELVLVLRSEVERHKILKVVGERSRVRIPSRVVDGLSLIWYSDLVIGAGGTMNREAAVLGVPAYSVFQGKRGAVDAMLEKENKLEFICSNDDFRKIQFKKRTRPQFSSFSSNGLIDFFVNEILSLSPATGNGRKA